MSNKEKNTKDTDPIDERSVEQEQVVSDAEHQSQEIEGTETDKVQELDRKLTELNDKYLRLYSEYENYRKRTNLEKTDLLLNGSREMIKAILPVVDDFERALSVLGKEEGVLLIYNKMMKILEQKGLKAMEVKGERFDENLHEAITRIPAADESQKGIVIEVVEKGYYLNDKVLRYAKVVVAC